MLVCPTCGSSRIRTDYKPTSIWLRIVGIRNLLCDFCNKQFRAFSIRSPKPKNTRTTRKANVFNPGKPVDLQRIRLNLFNSKENSQTVSGEVLAPPTTGDLRTKITKLNIDHLRLQKAK